MHLFFFCHNLPIDALASNTVIIAVHDVDHLTAQAVSCQSPTAYFSQDVCAMILRHLLRWLELSRDGDLTSNVTMWIVGELEKRLGLLPAATGKSRTSVNG